VDHGLEFIAFSAEIRSAKCLELIGKRGRIARLKSGKEIK
jgi:hypothetical protein